MSWLRNILKPTLIRLLIGRPTWQPLGVTKTVAPLAPERIAEIEAGIAASLARRQRETEAASERSLRGWNTRRAQVDRSRDPILPHRAQLLARAGRPAVMHGTSR
ncbi:hypothetical protein [Rhizorhabdus sp.]|uniref:hypothetical protein n=1 Tax=Rhizorhabdus sp. TaxID=1968843 RepID=UPI0019985A6C|nr:hypothetical protein [Rhizorhabdus sp.]MBD3762622.1 hypothetical protein [Rhizorhabdus sp.]